MAIVQAVLEEVYNNAILAEDPNLAPALEQGQDLYFKRKAVTQVTSTASEENTTLENNIFPASASSTFLYKHAANLGLPLVTGATPSAGKVTLTIPATTSAITFTINSGDILTNSNTGVQYYFIDTVTYTSDTSTTLTPTLYIQSVLSGKTTYAAPGTILTLQTPKVLNSSVTISTVTVASMISGQDTPTDLDVSNIIYSYMQYPRGGGSSGDYYKWALQSDSSITQAVIISTGTAGAISGQTFFLVAVMAGTSDPSVNITTSYPIDRAVSTTVVNTCKTYLDTLRPINDNPQVITVSTFGLERNAFNYVTQSGILNPVINLTVALADGLTVDTLITGTTGVTKSVKDWITYQFRYAILSMPYTGVTYSGGQYLLGEQITTLLSNGLGSTQSFNGSLCSILVNATFTYSDNNVTNIPNIPVPNSNQYYTVGTPTTISIIYDIDVSIIVITEV